MTTPEKDADRNPEGDRGRHCTFFDPDSTAGRNARQCPYDRLRRLALDDMAHPRRGLAGSAQAMLRVLDARAVHA